MTIELVIRTSSKDRHLRYKEDTVVVGRSDECTLAVNTPSMSRRHAVFTGSGDQVTVRDLDSRNGVRVNGRKVTEQDLEPGDRVELGKMVLFFRWVPADQAHPRGGLLPPGRGGPPATDADVGPPKDAEPSGKAAAAPPASAPADAAAAPVPARDAGDDRYLQQAEFTGDGDDRGGGGRGSLVPIAAAVVLVAVLGGGAFLTIGASGGGTEVPPAPADSLLETGWSFEGPVVPGVDLPEGWIPVAGLAVQGIEDSPDGSAHMELEAAAGELAEVRSQATLPISGPVTVRAQVRWSGAGPVGLLADWLEGDTLVAVGHAVLDAGPGWTPVEAALAPPPGADGLRLSLVCMDGTAGWDAVTVTAGGTGGDLLSVPGPDDETYAGLVPVTAGDGEAPRAVLLWDDGAGWVPGEGRIPLQVTLRGDESPDVLHVDAPARRAGVAWPEERPDPWFVPAGAEPVTLRTAGRSFRAILAPGARFAVTRPTRNDGTTVDAERLLREAGEHQAAGRLGDALATATRAAKGEGGAAADAARLAGTLTARAEQELDELEAALREARDFARRGAYLEVADAADDFATRWQGTTQAVQAAALAVDAREAAAGLRDAAREERAAELLRRGSGIRGVWPVLAQEYLAAAARYDDTESGRRALELLDEIDAGLDPQRRMPEAVRPDDR